MVPVTRSEVCLLPDPKRVISKPFLPGGEVAGRLRVQHILDRVLALSEATVAETLLEAYGRFSSRHVDLTSVLERRFADVAHYLDHAGELSLERRRLIGAYFTHEYSMDAAALSNPSLVRAP